MNVQEDNVIQTIGGLACVLAAGAVIVLLGAGYALFK